MIHNIGLIRIWSTILAIVVGYPANTVSNGTAATGKSVPKATPIMV